MILIMWENLLTKGLFELAGESQALQIMLLMGM